jgi:threonylcarbamoyladenosine tRNA methylthiotransferase MtaB
VTASAGGAAPSRGFRVHLAALGCRLNQAEMDALGGSLAADGLDLAGDADGADIIVLNTCAVTAEAERDARRMVRRWHRLRPEAAIVLTGCQATLKPAELAALPGVAAVVGNAAKDGLRGLIGEWLAGSSEAGDPESARQAAAKRVGGPEPKGGIGGREDALAATTVLPPAPGRTRAFVAVQDGCDQGCAFCAATLARGASRSRSLAEVVAQVGQLVAAGYQEAVLTGAQLGAYGRDLGLRRAGLPGLVRGILEHTGLPRLRLSSLEPWDLGPGLGTLWADDRLMPQLHLPIQTGSDALRRRMARRGRVDTLRRLVEEARAAVPELALGTDLIAGLPGETDADHRATLALVRELSFVRLHVFPFSPRAGTAAAAMEGQVPLTLRRQRAAELAAAGRELARGHAGRLAGAVRLVLWEAPGAEVDSLGRRSWSGQAPDGTRVRAWSAADLWNRILPTALALEADGTGEEGLSGRVVLG